MQSKYSPECIPDKDPTLGFVASHGNKLRVNFFKSNRRVSGQNLNHLHTIAIQTSLVHIKTGPSSIKVI